MSQDYTELIEDIKREVFEKLSKLSPGELASGFAYGSLHQKIVYWDYLETKPKEFQEEFRKHLDDKLLG